MTLTVTEELSPRAVYASMTGVVAVMLLAALDATIVGTAMPRIIAELRGFEQYAAVTTVYMLAATVVVPIAGKLSDLYGRKPFLLAGVAIFVLGSALCGVANSMTGLIVFRGIQGLGGGIAQGMAFTTVADLFPPARRGRVSGLLGAVFGLASVIGPAVGGFLTDGPGWRWCFFVNLPIGIAAFAILFFAFPHIVRNQTDDRRVPWGGSVVLVLAVVPLLLALSWGGRDYPWASLQILALATVGLVMSLVFVIGQNRTSNPIIPPTLFGNRVVRTAAGAAMLISLGMFGSVLFIPLFIQAVVGRSPTQSGAVMTPMMFALIGASMVAGQLMNRTGKYKAIGVTGAALTTAGMFLLSMMDVSTTYSAVVSNMMVVGVGLGLTLPVFNVAVQNAVAMKDVGVATSSMQFLRSIGGSVGAAVFGAVLTTRFSTVLAEKLSSNAAPGVPMELLSKFSNPQVLMNPEVSAQMTAAGPETIARMAPVVRMVKDALSASLHDVFLASTVVAAGALICALLLVDVPLRQSNR